MINKVDNLFKATGNIIYEISEYEYNGVRFLYKKGFSNRIFCFFSSFSKKGQKQAYNYLKMSLSNDSDSFIYFLDSDSPSEDPRGTYFLGKNSSYLDYICDVLSFLKEEILNHSFYFFGSSKGGSGALLVATRMNEGTVFVNAPQIQIGNYLSKRNKYAIKEIGISKSDLNQIILEELKNQRFGKKFKIIVSCGVLDEEHLKEHLNVLFQNKRIANKIEFLPLHGAHDGKVLADYQLLVRSLIEQGSFNNKYLAIEKDLFLYANLKVKPELFGTNIAQKSLISKIRDNIIQNINMIIDKNNIPYVIFRNMYGFMINVYALDVKNVIIAKSASYNNEQTFELSKFSLSKLEKIRFFIKGLDEIIKIDINKEFISIYSLSTNSDEFIQKPIIKKMEWKNSFLKDYINVDRREHLDYTLFHGRYTYQYFINTLNIIFYCDFKESDKLTVFLPGAVNRTKSIFNFQRHSWSQDIEGSVISFLDPTVQESNDIKIGWFQGNKETYGIPLVINFIKLLLQVNGIKEENVTFFGSSAGGFTSLKLSNKFKHSRIIVNNPQTRIFNYFQNPYSKMVSWVFAPLTPEKVKNMYNDRLKISLELKNRTMPIIYLQNLADRHHVERHLKPLLNTIDDSDYCYIDGLKSFNSLNKQLNIVYYLDEKSGHDPVGKEDTIKILNNKY